MEWNAKSSSFFDWDSSLPPPPEDFALSSSSELETASFSKGSISARIGSPSRVGDDGNRKNLEGDHLCQDTVSTGDEGSKDLPMGLKLGKRTYFENDGKAPLAQLSSGKISDTRVKKTRMSHQSVQNVCCQVEGCAEDLSTAKGYHRKHKVCEAHSKCPLVIVAGQELRFCQQCSRFHALSKFDQKKRSCRRRLSDHNARRRKPQQAIISFSSAALSSSAYANNHHMNILWSKDPSDSLGNSGNFKCKSSYGFKFPQESGLWQKTMKVGSPGGTIHLPNSKLYDFSKHSHEANMLLPLRGITGEVHNQGSESSIVASNLVEAPDLQRALSLLSVGSWVPPEQGQQTSPAQLVSINHTGSAQSMVQVVDFTSDFPFPLQSNGDQLKELQLYKAPYGTSFFGSSQIH